MNGSELPTCAAEPSDAAVVRELVEACNAEGGSIAWPLECFRLVTSTMECAKERRISGHGAVIAAAAGAAFLERTIYFAEEQSQGRGRQGRRWISSPGAGLYLTFCGRIEGELSRTGGLSLAVGLGIARALDRLGARLLLKWPNDLYGMVDNEPRKVGGILIESWQRAGEAPWLSIGIGINVLTSPHLGEVGGAALADILPVGSGVSRNEVFAAVTGGATRACDDFFVHGFSPIRAEWEGRSLLSGREIEAELGGVRAKYRVLGVGDDGGLRLLSGEGNESTAYSGEVTIGHVARD